jgi:hypothetical protein
MRYLRLLAAGFFVCLMASSLAAQQTSAESEYNAGSAALNQKPTPDYVAALQHYHEAHRLGPSPQTALSVAYATLSANLRDTDTAFDFIDEWAARWSKLSPQDARRDPSVKLLSKTLHALRQSSKENADEIARLSTLITRERQRWDNERRVLATKNKKLELDNEALKGQYETLDRSNHRHEDGPVDRGLQRPND